VINYGSISLADIYGDGGLDAFISNGDGNIVVQPNTAWVAPVSTTTANGTYGVGSVITLKVKFSENVLVTGAPTLALETGDTDRAAVYTGGSGTSTLTFKYTVQAGDTSADLDYVRARALSLNGGTLRDAAGNDADLRLAAPGEPGNLGSLTAGHAIVIDTTAPTLDPVGATDAHLRAGFFLTFSEAVVKGTGTIVLKTAAGAMIESYDVATSADLTLSTDKTTLTLNPSSHLAYSTAYKVELAAGTFKDLAGNSFAGSTSYSFTTEGTTYTGTAGADSLAGGVGSDTLDGGAGADTLAGGDGSDIYYVNSSLDVVTETNALADTGGIDQVNSTLAAYTLGSNIENGAILATGTASLTGNGLDNVLYAGVGSNVLDGGSGIDTVSYANASAGIKISLAATAAQATGGSGSDTLRNVENLTGSSYADSLTGNTLDNTLNGGAGADTLIGGDGSDTYDVDNSLDVVRETDALADTGGIDQVNTTLAAYTLGANVENGAILASGTASLTGNSLDNVLYAGAGSNVLDGGAGVDIVSYANASAGVTASLATTGAQDTGSSGSDTLENVEKLVGSSYADSLTGSTLDNTLNGGAGADTLVGGDGSDIYYVNSSLDVVSETDALSDTGGLDRVNSYLNAYTLGTNVENGRILAKGTASLSGNDLNNALCAGAGNNVLDGGTGTDTVSYYYASAGITASLATTGAQDTGSSGSDTLKNIENLAGSTHADKLTGNALNNTLNGGAGADTLIGGDGNDNYYVDSSLDVVRETNALESTGGIDRVNSYLTAYTLGANIENGRILTSGTASLTGNDLDNVLYAGAGNNALSGRIGDDTLTGGQGADQLTGGTGADHFDFNTLAELGLSSATRDTITDFNTSEADKIDLLGVDANTTLTGNQAFSFLGAVSAFTDNATGQLRFDAAAHILYGSTDADTAAEFAIALTGVSSLNSADLVL
jgi:Ca2+-binding RTX toxin-like protein